MSILLALFGWSFLGSLVVLVFRDIGFRWFSWIFLYLLCYVIQCIYALHYARRLIRVGCSKFFACHIRYI